MGPEGGLYLALATRRGLGYNLQMIGNVARREERSRLQEDQAMIEQGSKTGTFRFSIKPGSDAKKVQLVGDFSEWKPMAMTRQKDGAFAATVRLAPGTYEYKFVVDGQWRVDPDNGAWALNPFGTLNSVATVQ